MDFFDLLCRKPPRWEEEEIFSFSNDVKVLTEAFQRHLYRKAPPSTESVDDKTFLLDKRVAG